MVGEIHSGRFRTASQHGRPQGSSDGQQHKAPGTRGPPRGHFEKSKAVALAVICDRQAERNERLTPFEPASFRLLLERRRDNTSVCSQCRQRNMLLTSAIAPVRSAAQVQSGPVPPPVGYQANSPRRRAKMPLGVSTCFARIKLAVLAALTVMPKWQ